jgi:hypothetical protein
MIFDDIKIPYGLYCYEKVDGKNKLCPYWRIKKDFESLEDCGSCLYMQIKYLTQPDDNRLDELVKVCGINISENE